MESWREFLDEAKEEDIQKKYGFDGGVGEDGKDYAHFAYNQLVTWVNQDRPKRIKLLDWMAKQIVGTAWDDTEAMQKVDDEKAKAENLKMEEEAKKSQVELSEQAQIKEDDGKDEEEEVTSKNMENVDPEEAA